MKVLLSIKPEYAEKILDGRKRFEFRKAIPKNQNIKTVVIYATKPVGKIVGEFDIDSILSAAPRELWRKTAKFSGISKFFFDRYFCGRNIAHAIAVKNVRQYDSPIELGTVLGHSNAPQSFCYID